MGDKSGNEALAEYVASYTAMEVERDKQKGQNWMVPKPPKPGEIIYCTICGQPMKPEDFSKDAKIRRLEFKWHFHNACKERCLMEADYKTNGLRGERTSKGVNLALLPPRPDM